MEIVLALLLGGFFGFALYYAGATKPSKIKGMLSFNDLSVMKIIVFAIGFSAVLVSLTGILGILDVSHFSVKTTHLGVILGGLIFGLGFGYAGSCPGTCVAGVAGGSYKKAISTVLGGLVGAFLYSISYGGLKAIGLFDQMNLGKITLFKISEKYPSVLEVGFGGLLLFGAAFIVIALILPVNPQRAE